MDVVQTIIAHWARPTCPQNSTTRRDRSPISAMHLKDVAPRDIRTTIATQEQYLPYCGAEHDALLRLILHCHGRSPRTTSIASFWQVWHSKVRCSQPGPSGAIRVSHIGAPHFGHVGCTMSCKCEMDWNWRMAAPRCIEAWVQAVSLSSNA